MEEKKTFTKEEVDNIARNIMFRERVVSAMLTAIQRSIAAGDEQIYTDALRTVLNAQLGTPQPKPELETPAGEPDASGTGE